MSEADRITGGAALLGALAVVSAGSPAAERVISATLLVLLGLGTLGGLAAWRVHVLRIRRSIEEHGTCLRRNDPYPATHRRPPRTTHVNPPERGRPLWGSRRAPP